MSDALEMALKEAVKKIVAEAIAESVQEKIGKAELKRPIPSTDVFSSIAREKFMFTLKGLTGVTAALSTCGIIVMTLFAPEIAGAAIARHPTPTIAPQTASFNASDISWNELANMDNVQMLIKTGALLHPTPEDLAAIVIFNALRKASHGEPIDIRNLENEFRESLPNHWVPAFDAVKAEFPAQQPLPGPQLLPNIPPVIALR